MGRSEDAYLETILRVGVGFIKGHLQLQAPGERSYKKLFSYYYAQFVMLLIYTSLHFHNLVIKWLLCQCWRLISLNLENLIEDYILRKFRSHDLISGL